MSSSFQRKIVGNVFVLLALAACGGGGSSGGGGPTNRAPNADAGSDQTVDEQTSVILDGSGSSDPDGNNLSYIWTQTSGASVAVASANSAQASFDAPNVGIGSIATLTFRLQVNDGTVTNIDTISIVVNGVSNSDPTADAGADQASTEGATVNLPGSATDGDLGDSLSFAWTQLTGTGVSITGNDMANASFVAPDVGAGGETLTFQLAVDDGTVTVTDTVDVTVMAAPVTVNVAGKVSYQFVPPNNNCRGLNFGAIQTRPIRAATVQLIDAGTGNVIDTTTAADNGDYAFSNVAVNLNVRLRVRAELKRSGGPTWDVEVRDNVDTSASPPPLASRPLYVADFANFNTGGADVTRDETAMTGWGGSSYTGNRVAAPFAILDAIYSGMQLILTADPNAVFGPMDAFWSVNNTANYTGPENIDTGEVGTFYRPSIDSLFLLGDANHDTDEFDAHVSVHEWGHYFEDVFSRSDSIGGSHSNGQSLDARLAFSEGWGYAMAAMALNETQSCDTTVPGTSGGFEVFDTENDDFGPQGWYSEESIVTFLYDLWDTAVDGTDNDSIGFKPIYDTLTGPQRTTAAFTTVFSFAAELRPMLNSAQQTFVDSQLVRESIETAGIDIWGSTENNDAGGARDVLPLYTSLPTDGTPITVCANSDFDSARVGNKLAERRFLRIDVSTPGVYTVTINTQQPTSPPLPPDDPQDPSDQSDPDIAIQRDGITIAEGDSGSANFEILTTPALSNGTYVAELREFRYGDPDTPSDFPEQICFNVSMSL